MNVKHTKMPNKTIKKTKMSASVKFLGKTSRKLSSRTKLLPKLLHSKKISKQLDKTDWNKIKALTDKEIRKATKDDPDAKILTQAELRKFKRVHSPKEIDVKVIRHALHLSQEEFASYFGVNKRTVQEWEQGRRTPTATARNFLKVIEREPKAVQRALIDHHHAA